MTASLTLPLEQNAVISSCGRYRYLLTRQVGPGPRTATFIMLNPSTADAANDDPTIRRCIGFARQWGCGRLAVLNLFAYRATIPVDMKGTEDPVGPENRDWFNRTLLAPHEGPVVCAWCVHGEHRSQDLAVLGWLADARVRPLSLGVTRDGHPKHPLYLPKTAELMHFVGRLTQTPRGSRPVASAGTGAGSASAARPSGGPSRR
jgi:hypothetical protein